MKTLLLHSSILCGSFFIGFSASLAAGLDPSNMINASSMETSCVGANVSHHMYMANGVSSIPIVPSDNFRWDLGDANTLTQIMENTSQVSIWSRTASASCSTGWYRGSWVIPGDGQWYNALFRPTDMPVCTISRPATISPSQPVVQFVYKVAYKPQIGLQAGTSGYYYFFPSSMITMLTPTSTPNNTKRVWGPQVMHDNECQNYYVSYCGDGVVDNRVFDNGVTGSEQCDLGAQNGQPGSTCSATCQTVTANPYSACVVGDPTASCNTNTYADNAACLLANPVGSGRTCYLNDIPACNATRAAQCPALAACVPGPTTGPQPAPLTAASVGLCPVGQAVGGFTGTTVGTLTTYNWSCGGSAVGGACAATYNSGPTIPGFDLSLKKYIGTNDAQTLATGVATSTNSALTYVLRVTNSGSSLMSSSGTTVVQDILPAGVEYDVVAASGSGWTCGVSTRTLTCTSTGIIVPGSSYPDISVPFRVTATTGQNVTNIAAVDNQNEFRRCMPVGGGVLPTTVTGVCTLDATNSDPAVLYIPGGGGGSYYYVPVCANGISSCATQVHNSMAACQIYNPGKTCYNALQTCQANNTLTCSGNGGGGYCGDGVLQIGEECDLGNGNSDAPEAACTKLCKLNAWTNPGANPITDIWMTIPSFSNTRLGYSWLDGEAGKISFIENRMVLGAGTRAFTLADTVGFGIKTKYTIPLAVEANKSICLDSTGNGLNHTRICTQFGNLVSDVNKFTPYGSTTQYVLIGHGDFQIKTASGYAGFSSTAPNNVTLFKGSTYYGSQTLRDTFKATNSVNEDGKITLINIATTTGEDIPLVSLNTHVSGARVGATSSTVNRSLASYLQSTSALSVFLSGFSKTVSGLGTTTTTTTTTSNNGTANINLNIPTSGNKFVSTISGLETFAVNGNKNILALKNGNLTLDGCGNSLALSGIRTVIVEGGNLIIKCNLTYADANASWAFIVKGGNIIIDKAVTNLAGVYVVIPVNGVGGSFQSMNNEPTANILRLSGSMYGNAKPLFDTRLYVRGTTAYDILTTGVILSYSNRALVNPPPLLSSYLNNYSVTRVVK